MLTVDGIELRKGMTIYVLNDVLGYPVTIHEVGQFRESIIIYADKTMSHYGCKPSRAFASPITAEAARKVEELGRCHDH